MKQDDPTRELLPPDNVRFSREGFYHCKRCLKMVTPSQYEVDAAENAPAGSLMELRCPLCRHRTVSWHPPSPAKRTKPEPEPVPVDKAAGLFLAMKHAAA